MATAQPSKSADPLFDVEHLRVDLAGRSVSGGAVTIAAQGLKFALMVASQILLARLLVPYDWGLIGMVTAVTGFLALFKDLGLSSAIVQRPQITHGQVNALFWINLALSAGICLLTVALAAAVARFYSEPALKPVTMVLGTGFLFGGITVQHQALLTRQMRFTALAWTEVIAMAAAVAAGVVAALSGLGYWALVLVELTRGGLTAVFVWIACPWRPGLPARASGVGELLSFGMGLAGFGVVNYVSRNLDNLLIGRIWGAQALGFYAKAYQLLVLPIQQVNGPLQGVAIPALSRLTEAPAKYRQAYLNVVEKLAAVTMPGVILMAGCADWVLGLLLGPQWAPTSRLFVLLAVAGVFQPVANSTGWLFITQARTKEMFRWGCISMVITVVSFLIGLPWGAAGVAGAYAGGQVLVTLPLLFFFVGRRGPVTTADFFRTLKAPALAAAVTAGVILLFRLVCPVTNPIVGVVLASAMVVTANAGGLALTREGRCILRELPRLAAKLRERLSVSVPRTAAGPPEVPADLPLVQKVERA